MIRQSINLNGIWKVRPDDFSLSGNSGIERVLQSRDGWIDAEVPGEVHLDLINAGMMEEPTVGDNMPDCRWPETRSWWFKTDFKIEQTFLDHERQLIVFGGLDLYGQVFINGKPAGESANAFVPVEIDVKGLLAAGRNELVVRLTAGSELALDETPAGQNQPETIPNSAVDGGVPNPAQDGELYAHRMWPGRKWLRKPQFSYGWDWVDALPNIGIWRDVHLEARSYAIIHSLRVDTIKHFDSDAIGAELPDAGPAFLELEVVIQNLHPWSERRCFFDIEIEPPDGTASINRRYEIAALPGRIFLHDQIEIPDPQWWWPNGMGEQPLYRVTGSVSEPNGTETDSRSFNFGIRTIEINRSPLPEGSRFCFCVNGREVFCRGGNIGPHDAILARISGDKYRAIVSEAKNANMNMLRINGCSIFEDSSFYDACDRNGILVWQDFMLTCTTYPEEHEELTAAVKTEVEMAVALLRHHPSIALWCGNNECQMGFEGWWNPDPDKHFDLGGQKLYNEVFPELCRALDPHRPYWPGSPCGGENANGEISGDCHWWDRFFMNPDMERRIRHEVFDECRGRFVSEYGVIGPCHLDSIRQYLGSEGAALVPGSKHAEAASGIAWQRHTNSFEKDTVAAAVKLHYADPEELTVSEYILYGQLYQAFIHGHAMEALRFRKNDSVDDCQGALIWSYSDAWGETGWSILDYYLRRKPSYYWFRRACAPVKVIVRKRDKSFITRIVNDTLQESAVAVEFGWWRLDGEEKETQNRAVSIRANGMLEVEKVPVALLQNRNPREWLFAAIIRNEAGQPFDQSLWPLLPHRELALQPPEISVKSLGGGSIEVSSRAYCHAVHIEDHGHEMMSDNWFDLLPGVPVRLTPARNSHQWHAVNSNQ